MIKLLQFARRYIAIIAAWAGSRRRRRTKASTATALSWGTSQEVTQGTAAELHAEVVSPATQAETGQSLDSVALPRVTGDAPIPESELPPVLPNSSVTDLERPTETSPITSSPTATFFDPLIDDADRPGPPHAVVPTERQNIPAPHRPPKNRQTEEARRIAPERRGGGQMEAAQDSKSVTSRKRVRSGPQLRLICFRGNDRLWRLAVELPEEFSPGCDIDVNQNGQTLERVGFNENRWPLNRLDGCVEAAETRNGGQRWQLEIGCDECLIFKLLEESETEEGRLVSAPSRGDYLVITPGAWPMPESSGIQLSRERNVGIDGHVGYRFIVRDGVLPKLEFGQRGFQGETVRFRTACFTLAGERADAISGEYQAPLFLRSPPCVHAPDSESWSDVQKFVLGVAGKGRNKWKKAFKPSPANNEVQLSEHLNGRTSGWYFVRLYDVNEVLMDSLYFAFARTLRGVKVSGASALPAVSGHTKARLEFEHDAGASVKILGEHEPQPFDSGTAFIVPPCCEQVDWEISWPGESSLKCTTRIERVWWAFGSEDTHSSDSKWTDQPVAGKRAHFVAASEKVLRVRLPCTNSMDKFLAGFARDAARPYIAMAGERDVSIPLRDFSASNEVHTVGLAPFRIWVWQNGHEVFVEALHLEIVYECCFCQKQFNTDDEALVHAVEHEKEFIRELTYEELRRLNPELPAAIYQCVHPACGFYAREDEAWATSVITGHIQEKHGSRCAPAHIAFRSVTDPAEIRRNVERHLPKIFRCRCGERFANVRPEDFAEHIVRKHRSQLFDLV